MRPALLLLLAAIGISIAITVVRGATAALNAVDEGRVIGECLERFGGLTPDTAQRLQRFKEWSATYEEIPCFTKCYLSKAVDFFNETSGFDEQRLLRHFKRPVFEACRERLTDGIDSCALAYNGFHCLVSLENDPFIIIEAMELLSTEAKTAMKDCLRHFDQFEWARLSDYGSFPVREPIPCFTKCFLDKLQLFNVRLKRWHLEAMRNKLGVPHATSNIDDCLTLRRKRKRNACTWMYREFTCFVLAQ